MKKFVLVFGFVATSLLVLGFSLRPVAASPKAALQSPQMTHISGHQTSPDGLTIARVDLVRFGEGAPLFVQLSAAKVTSRGLAQLAMSQGDGSQFVQETELTTDANDWWIVATPATGQWETVTSEAQITFTVQPKN